MNQLLINLGLLLLLIPIVMIFKGNMYALIIGMALPCIHYGWLVNKGMNEYYKEMREQ